MAISRLTVWTSGQILTAAALNGEFNNIINNGVDSWSPATKSVSFGGFAVVYDSAGVSNLQSPGTSGFLFTPGAKSGSPSVTGGTLNVAGHTYTDTGTSASGTATAWTGVSVQQPTLAAGNSTVTTTDAATFYVAGPPIAGTNQTLSNGWAFWSDAGGVRMDCTTSKASAASAVCRAFYLPASTQTITGGTNITTTTGYNFIEIGQPTMSAASSMTITNAATLYIADAPAAGGAGPSAITNPYAIWVDDGNVRMDDNVTVGDDLAVQGNADVDGTLNVGGALTMDGTNNAIVPASSPGTPVASGLYRENVCKGWANVSVSGGTPTLNNDFNVTSITDSGVGRLTVTWDRDFANTNYVVNITCRGVTTDFHIIGTVSSGTALSTGSFVAACVTGGNSDFDPLLYLITAYGDH
jgi:hypothetical protein